MTRLPIGIYKIENFANGKVYIGQSQNMYARWRQHLSKLKSGHHVNQDLQADWTKSSRSFRWSVVEYCSLEDLNKREKYWINYYDSINTGYNKGWVPFTRKEEDETKKKKPKGYGR